jgi:hypothetical protein
MDFQQVDLKGNEMVVNWEQNLADMTADLME